VSSWKAVRAQAKELRKKRGINWKEATDEIGVPMRTLITCIGANVLRATANKIEAGVVRQTDKKPARQVRSQAHKRDGDQSSKLSNSVSQEKAAEMLNVSRTSVQIAKAVLDRGDELIARRRGWTSQFPRGGETARRERGPVQRNPSVQAAAMPPFGARARRANSTAVAPQASSAACRRCGRERRRAKLADRRY
jgi:hypothetical protein